MLRRSLVCLAKLAALALIWVSAYGAIDNWTLRNPVVPGVLSDVTHGDHGWVAVGSDGVIMRSLNAIDWQPASSGTTTALAAVTFGGGKYLAAGSDGSAFVSVNGEAWTQCKQRELSGTWITGIAFGAGTYVMVASNGTIVTSNDTVNWTKQTLTVPGMGVTLNSVCFGGGLFVAVGHLVADELLIFSSADGRNWTRRGSGLTSYHFGGYPNLSDVVYALDRFVAVGPNNVSASSCDGITWNPGVVPRTSEGTRMGRIAYSDGRFRSGGRLTSADGFEWREESLPSEVDTFQFTSMAGTDDVIVAVGGREILVRFRNADWRAVTFKKVSMTDAAYGNGRFVGYTSQGTSATSDPRRWTTKSLPNGTTFDRVAFGNGTFVACGEALGMDYTRQPSVFTSVDGLAWTAYPRAQYLRFVTHAGGKFYGAGFRTICSSVDGVTWSTFTFTDEVYVTEVVSGNGRVVATGHVITASGPVRPFLAICDDGETWIEQPTPPFSRLSHVRYGGGRFVGVERYSVGAWVSSDGVTWSQVTLPAAPSGGWNASRIADIEYADGWFVATFGNSILSSPDGVNWTATYRVLGNAAEEYSLAYGNGTFLVVGSGEVYQSSPSAQTIAVAAITQPATKPSGQPAQLWVTASGSNLTYQWYSGESGDTSSPIAGAVESTYTTPGILTNSRYWVRVSNGTTFVDSPTTFVSLAQPPSITQQPGDVDFLEGDTPVLNTEATGAPAPTLQWYRGAAGVTLDPVPGATSAVLTVKGVTEPARYWVRAQNSEGTADSRTSLLMPWKRRLPHIPASDIAFVNGLYVAVSGDIYTSTDGVEWTQRYTTTRGYGPRRIAYGNGRFVAVSPYGQLVSADGITWTVQNGSATDGYSSWICYGNGLFLSSSSNGVVSSPDGLTWSPVAVADGAYIRQVVFSEGEFVALARLTDSCATFTSADGRIWTRYPSPWGITESDQRPMRVVGNRILGWDGSKLYVTTDRGRTWSGAGTLPRSDVNSAVYGNGVYLVGSSYGDGGSLFRSTNGTTWEAQTVPIGMGTLVLGFVNGQFLAAGKDGGLFRSSDGATWAPVVSWPALPVSGLAYGNGRWVATGVKDVYGDKVGIAHYSTDLSQWTRVENAPAFKARTVFARGKFFSATGEVGKILVTEDGALWSAVDVSGASVGYEAFVVADDRVVAFGNNETAVTRDGGISWTAVPTNLPNAQRAVYGNGRYVAYGSVMWYSPDGVIWTRASTFLSTSQKGLAFGAGTFVSVGQNGKIGYSKDGDTWTERQLSVASTFSDVVFAGGRFIATCDRGYFTSVDGVTWTKSLFGESVVSGVIAYGDGRFLSADFPAVFQSARDLSEIVISQQPEDQAAVSGASLTLSVSASGQLPPSYQWFKDGEPIVGANSPSLTLANLQAADSGTYRVRITNSAGACVFSREAVVVVDPSAPSVGSHPASVSVNVGAPVTLAARFSGNPAPRYQWSKNGAPITAATNATLSFDTAQPADAGSYSVTATNAYGTVTSDGATVTVRTLLVSADVQPVVGSSTTLSVDCVEGATYQWRYKGTPIAGATNATFTVSDLTRARNGLYDVVLTYAAGPVTSFGYGLDAAPAQMPNFYSADRSFAPRFEREGMGQILVALLLADGKFLVGGDFTSLDGVPRSYLARLNADGTLDQTYVPPAFTGPVRAMASLPDGRVVVAGDFAFAGGRHVGRIARLNTDLTLDTGFPVGVGCNDTVHAVAAQPDGSVVAAGAFYMVSGGYRSRIVKLDSAGNVVSPFSHDRNVGTGRALLRLPDGKWMFGGGGGSESGGTHFLIRLNADGSWDSTFDVGSFGLLAPVYALFRQPDGKIVAAGDLAVQGQPGSKVMRFAESGAVDTTFRLEEGVVPNDGNVSQLVDAGSGGFWIAGRNVPLTRITSSGARDTTFSPAQNPAITVTTISPESDGIRIWGTLPSSESTPAQTGFLKLSSAGQFSAPAGLLPRSTASLFQAEMVSGGMLLVRGGFTHVNGVARTGMARLLAGGDLDTRFTSAAPLSLENTGPFVLQSDGRILVHDGAKLRRLLSDGAEDGSFVPVAYVPSALALDRDGRPLIAGRASGGIFAQNGVKRLLSDGSEDSTFPAVTVSGFVSDINVYNDGRILLWGSFDSLNGSSVKKPVVLSTNGRATPSSSEFGLARPSAVSANGDPWLSGRDVYRYGISGEIRYSNLYATAVLPLPNDGMITAKSSAGSLTENEFISRYSAAGVRDAAFHADGLSLTSNLITSMVLQDDGSIIGLGSRLSAFGAERFGLVRLVPATAPSITVQPVSVQADADGNATLSLVAEGTGPLTYQWFRNGMAVAGATRATLELRSLVFTDLGAYTVRVGNAFGSVTSGAVTIRGANPAPRIITQPASRVGVAGTPVSLSVAATGVGTLSYQWRKSGHHIPGATKAELQIVAPTRADAGLYDVLVADGLTVTISEQVRLDVAPRSYPNGLALDPSFTPKFERPGGLVTAVLPTPDGKFVVSGDFTRIVGVEVPGLVRLDASLNVDTSFTAPKFLADVMLAASNERCTVAAAVQPDGKVLVIRQLEGTTQYWNRSTLVRLLPDGSVDSTFNMTSLVIYVDRIAVQPDGKIIVIGYAKSPYLNGGMNSVFRVNADGSIDSTYAPRFEKSGLAWPPQRLAVQPDGKAVFIGDFDALNGSPARTIARVTTSGVLDQSFAVTNVSATLVSALHVEADGRLVLAGFFERPGENSRRIVRLGVNGAFEQSYLDSDYDRQDATWVTSASDGTLFLQIAQSSGGKLLRLSATGSIQKVITGSLGYATATDGNGGFITSVQPLSTSDFGVRLAHVARDGTLADTAQCEIEAAVVDVEPSRDGGVYVLGEFSRVNGSFCSGVARLNADGSLDQAFSANSRFAGTLSSILRLPDDKLLVSGPSMILQGQALPPVARLNRDGTRDRSFDFPMSQSSPDHGEPLTLLADGRVLVGAKAVFSDGSTDGGFALADGMRPLLGVALPGGDVIVTDGLAISSVRPNGQVIASTSAGLSRVGGFAVQPDGNVVIGGAVADTIDGALRSSVVRVTRTFGMDGSFAAAERIPERRTTRYPGANVLVQEDGRIIVNDCNGLLRLEAGGAVDSRFLAGKLRASLEIPMSIPRPLSVVELMDDGSLLVGDSIMDIEGKRARGLRRFVDPAAVRLPSTPTTQTAFEGDATLLNIAPGGTGPFTYQWLKNGAAIPGATDASLSISAASMADAGYYSVVVRNANGPVQSVATYLDVRQPTLPNITSHPARQVVKPGETARFSVTATGQPAPRYQWRKYGAAITGATNASFAIFSVAAADEGTYSVAVTNTAGTVVSNPAGLVILPAGLSASHRVADGTEGANPTFTVSNTFTYEGAAPQLSWQVLLPEGWTIASTGGDGAATTKPAAGATSVAEWTWPAAPASPFVFTYTLNAPAARAADDAVAALVTFNTGTEIRFMAKPDPLPLMLYHAADTDRDWRISLTELTRVIELYNTRVGTTRSGCYQLGTATEDGFAPDTAREALSTVVLSRFHSADSDRDGRLSLTELTRVIELYNFRVGTGRTGDYHVQSDTEDGFAPGFLTAR